MIKTGRTHLQDATPIRLGQVFRGYAGQMERGLRPDRAGRRGAGGGRPGRHRRRNRDQHPSPSSPRGSAERSRIKAAVAIRGKRQPLPGPGHARLGRRRGSERVRTIAVSPAQDRQRHAAAGLGTANRPGRAGDPRGSTGKLDHARQGQPRDRRVRDPGRRQVIANDQAIVQAGEWSFFELNTMLPLAGHNLVQSIELLGCRRPRTSPRRCVRGPRRPGVGPEMVERGSGHRDRPGAADRLRQGRGHRQTRPPRAAKRSGRSPRRQTDLSAEQLDAALDPFKMTEPTRVIDRGHSTFSYNSPGSGRSRLLNGAAFFREL